MQPEELDKLAELSKIEISEDEKAEFAAEIPAILEYVSDVQKVSGGQPQKEAGDLRNVFRDDTDPYTPEAFTEEILEDAPETRDGYVKVKKIL